MKKQFAVFGLGTFGYSIALELAKKGADVLVVDRNEEVINQIKDDVSHAIIGDVTDEKFIDGLSLNSMDAVIVSIGENMEDSIFVTLILKELGVKNVVCRALSGVHYRVLKKMNADRIVFPEKDMAIRIAESLISPNILEQIEVTEGYSIVEINIPESMEEKKIIDARIRNNFGISIIAVRRMTPVVLDSGETDLEEELTISPGPEFTFMKGDIVVVIGNDKDIDRFKEKE